MVTGCHHVAWAALNGCLQLMSRAQEEEEEEEPTMTG